MKTLRLIIPLLLALAASAADAPVDNVTEAKAAHAAGLALQKERNIPGAIAAFEKATALDPTKPDYFSALGIGLSEKMKQVTFVEQGLLAGKMRKAFVKSVELDANHLPGLIGLARFYANAPAIAGGSIEKAKTFAQRVLALNPFLGEVELGNIAEQEEDFSAALAHYDAALKLQPKNAALHVSAGKTLAKLGRKDEARTRLETALALDPQRESAKKALAELEDK